MGKQKKRFIQRILCGILCSAMIATSLIVPDMTAYAAPGDGTETVMPADSGSQSEGTLENEEGDTSGSEDNGTEDGSESGTDKGASSEDGSGSGTDEGAGADDGSGSGAEGDANKDDAADVKDDTADEKDEQDPADEEIVEEEIVKPAVSAERAVTAADGKLENGDFETAGVAATEGEDPPAAYWDAGQFTRTGADNGYWDAHKYVMSYYGTGEVSLSQTIKSFKAGNYTLSVDIYGDYTVDGTNPVSVKIEKVTQSGEEYTADGDPLFTKTLDEGPAAQNSTNWVWETCNLADKITLAEDADIRITFAGDLGTDSKTIKLDNVVLEEASDGPTEKMFYFYCAPEEGETEAFELGVDLWAEQNGHTITTSETEKASWNDTYYKMKSVEGYADWYQIPLTVTDEITTGESESGSDVGFAIYKKPASGEAEKKADFSGYSTGNPAIYEKLLAEDTKACAVKNWKGYVDNGTDKLATAVMRNVTLHVYAEDGAPYLQLSTDASYDKTLSKVNEETGMLEPLTSVDGDVGGGTGYALEQDEQGSDWYSITFSVPGDFILDGTKKICGLYNSGKSWVKDFMNGPVASDQAEWKVDFTPVFAGRVYYKDGEFLAEKPDVPVSDEKMFYFHYAPGEGETEPLSLGVELWSNEGGSITTSVTEKQGEHFVMSPVEGYAGWYQIPLNIVDEVTDAGSKAGFNIYREPSGGETDRIAQFDGWNYKDIYSLMLEEGTKTCAVKNGKGYVNNGVTAILRNITFHAYVEGFAPAFQLDGTGVSTLTVVNEETGEITDIPSNGTDQWNNNIWILSQTEDENWYEISFSVPGSITFDSKKVLTWEADKTADGQHTWTADFMNGSGGNGIDFTPVFAGKVYYKDGEFLAEKPVETPLQKLKKLIETAKALKAEDYKTEGWAALQTALTAAEAVVTKAEAEGAKPDEDPLKKEIQDACDTLEKAIDALIPSRIAEINVKKVALADDFITGADLSSYVALRESGVEFKDENGRSLSDSEFFAYLKEGGMNWVRIRIWNDPYDARGNGYGGGNNDLEKAKKIGVLATNAGMKVLMDFHYSDFWADPNKQKAPKAWANYTLEEKEKAVYDYTLDCLNQLRAAGVNVGMVQVGNETNNGICGVTGSYDQASDKTSWADMKKIFNAGSKAVRDFDKTCLVAVHFTDPQKGFSEIAARLDDATDGERVDYDVFASSFYPFGHGNTAKVRDSLAYVAKTYNKKVMVAETSWPTTLTDGDGLGYLSPTENTVYPDEDYGVSVQGQADEMRDLIDKVNQINTENQGEALGVFYWEPAWISPYYIKDENGNDNMDLYKKNQEMWEKYGSGWASSYSVEYDPDDAGKWYGGSAMDNSSWFDFDGTALPTAKIYSLIRTGATTEKAKEISSVQSQIIVAHNQGEEIQWNELKPVARYNDGSTEELPVTWNQAEREDVDKDTAGVYVVNGTAVGNDDYRRSYPVTLILTVSKNNEKGNWLTNPGFEDNKIDPWTVSPASNNIKTSTEDPHNKSTYGLHFWEQTDFEFVLSQEVTPAPGTYRFGAFIQGGGADNERDVQYAFVELTRRGQTKTYRKEFELDGWLKWSNPEIKDIVVEEGDKLKVGVRIKAKGGTWGTIDDCYLYSSHNVTVETVTPDEGGTVTPGTNRADAGDQITVTVKPTVDPKNSRMYYLKKLTLDGCSEASITETGGGTKTTENGKTVITWAERETNECKLVFDMPKDEVKISADFENLLDDSQVDINGKSGENYLVTVNGNATAEPIEKQLYSGKAVKPLLKLNYMGYELIEGKDYSVSYKNNSKKTTATAKAEATLKGKGKFTGERKINFEIIDDPRKPFDAKNLKIVFDRDDKGSTNVLASKAVFYLGKENELKPEVKIYAANDTTYAAPILSADQYEVHYQNNKKIGKATVVVIPKESLTSQKDENGNYTGYQEGSITATFSIAKCPLNQDAVEVIFPGGKDDNDKYYTYYTGGKLQPQVIVKYKGRTLTKGTDYTLSYSNNINANMYVAEKDGQGNPTKWAYKQDNRNSDPAVKITGKGNFTGARTTFTVNEKGQAGTDKITFNIRPRGIQNATITVEDLVEKTSAQTPKVTVKDGGKKIAANQYEIIKIEKLKEDGGKESVYEWSQTDKVPKVKFAAGKYAVTVAGKEKSNYAGQADPDQIIAKKEKSKLLLYVSDQNHLIKNAKVQIKGNFYYTGKPVTLDADTDANNLKQNPELKVSFTENGKEKRLINGQDYTLEYDNNVNAGKAEITIIGKGEYQGLKKMNFTIGKRALVATEATVKDTDLNKKSKLPNPTISFGRAVKEWDALSDPGTDYMNETDAARAPRNQKPLQKLVNSDNAAEAPLVIPYTGQVINPEFVFNLTNQNNAKEENTAMLKKEDYALSYRAGTPRKTAGGITYLPVTVTLTGKGNYSGSVKFENLFALQARELADFNITVASATYSGKAVKPEVIFRDKTTGKVAAFKEGVAYSVSYRNNTDATDNPKNVTGNKKKVTLVTVTVKGNGWVVNNSDINTKKIVIGTENEKEAFRIERAEITKACVGEVVFQTFLGKPLKPKVKVTVKGRTLREGTDYEIKYDENVRRGESGKVTITGKGNYFTRKPIERTFVIK